MNIEAVQEVVKEDLRTIRDLEEQLREFEAEHADVIDDYARLRKMQTDCIATCKRKIHATIKQSKNYPLEKTLLDPECVVTITPSSTTKVLPGALDVLPSERLRDPELVTLNAKRLGVLIEIGQLDASFGEAFLKTEPKTPSVSFGIVRKR